jgi:putative membrane protein
METAGTLALLASDTHNHGWPGALVGLLWLAVVGSFLFFVVFRRGCGWGGRGRRVSGRAILDERFARGEIDAAEYRRRRDELRFRLRRDELR